MADLIPINTDLHFHGLFSGGVSKKMIPRVIGQQAPHKGLQLIATADVLSERWIKLLKEQLNQVSEGILEHPNGTKFILQTEVEDKNRVHHIILFPSFTKVYELREKFKKHCKNLDADGRPKLWLGGEEIAEACIEADCLIGFAHAFTPYFGLYSKFNSFKDCYGSYWDKIHFLELGLSADTAMADRIAELQNITFTSNSDCHSPWPNKLGRELTRFSMADITFDELAMAIKRERGRKPILNVKLDPREGKYHKTRCRNCLLFFKLEDALKFNWRCPNCRNVIKKGVSDRVVELAQWQHPHHPPHRPPCIHIIPLSEIIAIALRIKQVWSAKVQELWQIFVNRFDNEINVLIDAPLEEITKVDVKTAELIAAFRNDKFQWIPGGAGVYGIPRPPGKKAEIKFFQHKQKHLGDFA